MIRFLKQVIRREKKTFDPRFTIEFYPKTKRYYPNYGRNYLCTNNRTGIIEEKENYLFAFCDHSETEEGAKYIIELFKEQRLKENVITIEL